MNNSRASAAIVTTLRDAGAVIDSFVAYHLAIGFAHLFLFFDDPDDPDRSRLAAHPQVTAIAHDDALRRQWKSLPEYPAQGPYADREVMARQVLNVGIAIELGRVRGLDWLLHIDSDELFYLPEGRVADHFSSAAADTIVYPNFEAVPEKNDIMDAFREVDLFKVSPSLGPGPFTPEGAALLRATPQMPQELFFHFYSNGKSAVRLSERDMRPDGVHRFSGGSATQAPQAAILHYACCGFESFWTKYRTLGRFSDRWLDKDDIRTAIGPLHLDARDVVASGSRERAQGFYCQRIAIQDPERAEALIRHGVLMRIPGPRRLLESLA